MRAPIPFMKMNGLGNDFVVIDRRRDPVRLTDAEIARIADRDAGIGCDQLIWIEPGPGDADAFMRIHNAEGAEVDACGNATRCIAALVMDETGKGQAAIATNAGLLIGSKGSAPGAITIDMGVPRFDWQDIPLSEPFDDTRGIELQVGPIDAPLLHTPSVVNIGNPHAIFWVDDLEVVDLAQVGSMLEHHPLFPARANISLARIASKTALDLKVWERGAGLTRACGTAACAAAVAAARKGLTERRVTVTLPGGPLDIDWRATDDHVLMTGPWQHDFDGEIDPGILDPEPMSA